jgi:hypothetical protein
MVLFEIGLWWRLVLFKITSSMPWGRWKVFPEKNYIIPTPQLKGYPRNIPSVLEPSKDGQASFVRGQTFSSTSGPPPIVMPSGTSVHLSFTPESNQVLRLSRNALVPMTAA